MGRLAFLIVPVVAVLLAALFYSQYRPQPLKGFGRCGGR